VLARGLLRQLYTRLYFPDEEEANAADPLLCSIEDEALRQTLIARRLDGVLAFDIHLQGERQTAFLDV
jgi:protocatechuate 3,4-dioxygenase alpha subunit